MKERIDRAFRSYQSVMVQMPTGTEKSKRFILSENVEECDALYDLYYDGENPPIFKKRKKSYVRQRRMFKMESLGHPPLSLCYGYGLSKLIGATYTPSSR